METASEYMAYSGYKFCQFYCANFIYKCTSLILELHICVLLRTKKPWYISCFCVLANHVAVDCVFMLSSNFSNA